MANNEGIYDSILIEESNELFKAKYSLAMKNHMSNDGEYMEVIKVLLSRIILDIGTNEADEMTKTEEQNEKENEFKIFYQELKSCALSVAQTHKDTAFVHIMKRTQENYILHVIRKRMEKYKKPINNGNVSVQYFVKDIFDLVMDLMSFSTKKKKQQQFNREHNKN